MAAFTEITEPRLLLVEGEDDEQFFRALVAYMNESHVQVEEVGGKGNIRPVIKLIRNDPNFPTLESFLIARDADDDPVAAFQSMQDALDKAGLPVPPETSHVRRRGTASLRDDYAGWRQNRNARGRVSRIGVR